VSSHGSRVRRVAGVIDPALWVLAFIGFISQVGIAVMLPLLPLYATELGASPIVLGLLTSLFAVTNAIAQVGSGFLAERWGARRMMTGGLGLYATMNALIATAASAPWLLTWRSLAGFGGGAMIISERIYLSQVVQPARRAFSNGIISAAQSAGAVAGPAVGSVAAAIGGLRAPFVLVALTSAIAFVGTLFLPAPVDAVRRAADENAVDEGPVPVRSLVTLLVANVALLASYGAFITTYAPMATTRLGWSIVEVGIAFSFFGGGSIVLGPWLAHLADRLGRRPVAVLAPIPLAGFAIGLVASLPQPAVFALAFLGGGGLTAFSAAWYALLADTAGERRLSRTFGIISAGSTIGIVIGALGAAQLWSRVDMGAGMILAALLPLVGCLAMLAFRPRALPLAA
jgi:MFS transporter, DHA1 family, multidrug resistance protein